jgi:Lon protease-like protein
MSSSSASASSFECSVCLRFLHEPATLPCGHSFCRRCLVQCLDHDLRCPSCRADVPIDSAAYQVNVMLAEALGLLFPSEAAERLSEMRDVPVVTHDGLQSFPLFVLEPLMPGQTMSLHVFEPRYIRLTQRALTEPRLQRSFGMIAPQLRHSNGLATHGTSAIIVHSSDAGGGRFYLTVKGGRRFKVLRTWGVDGYRNAAIEWAHDAPCAATTAGDDAEGTGGDEVLRNTLLAREVREVLKQWLGEVQAGWERHSGQVDNLLRAMGPMPPETELEALGLWGAAVINPLPPLGVAPEIRVLALESTESMVRLRSLLSALVMACISLPMYLPCTSGCDRSSRRS